MKLHANVRETRRSGTGGGGGLQVARGGQRRREGGVPGRREPPAVSADMGRPRGEARGHMKSREPEESGESSCEQQGGELAGGFQGTGVRPWVEKWGRIWGRRRELTVSVVLFFLNGVWMLWGRIPQKKRTVIKNGDVIFRLDETGGMRSGAYSRWAHNRSMCGSTGGGQP